MSQESSTEPNADRLASIISPEELDSPETEPSCVEFKPWHHPRKHYVRRQQWYTAVDALVPKLVDRSTINYLCLPGEDLLDVEVIAEVCGKHGRKLRFLGMERSEAQARRSRQRIAAEQRIHHGRNVAADSDVVIDPFERLAQHNTSSSRRVLGQRTYDVVNLDLCDTFTTTATRPMHPAVKRVVEHQCNRRAEPWLLFITSRSEADRLEPEELAIYSQSIQDNAIASQKFRDDVLSLLGVDSPDGVGNIASAMINLAQSDSHCCGQCICLGVGKWLLPLSLSVGWSVSVETALCYRSGRKLLASGNADGAPNHFSVVYRFTKVPIAAVDRTGLGERQANTVYARVAEGERREQKLEVECAKRMVRQLRKLVDVDALLRDKPEVLHSLSEDCKQILADRFYDMAAYDEWLAGRIGSPVA